MKCKHYLIFMSSLFDQTIRSSHLPLNVGSPILPRKSKQPKELVIKFLFILRRNLYNLRLWADLQHWLKNFLQDISIDTYEYCKGTIKMWEPRVIKLHYAIFRNSNTLPISMWTAAMETTISWLSTIGISMQTHST